MDMIIQDSHTQKQFGEKFSDSRKDEQARQISVKAKPMTLLQQNSKGKSFVLNIFDTPGHLNFSDEVLLS